MNTYVLGPALDLIAATIVLISFFLVHHRGAKPTRYLSLGIAILAFSGLLDVLLGLWALYSGEEGAWHAYVWLARGAVKLPFYAGLLYWDRQHVRA